MSMDAARGGLVRRVVLVVVVAGGVLLGVCSSAWASVMLDQSQTDTSGGGWSVAGPDNTSARPESVAQTFTAGLSGPLDRVDLYLDNASSTAPLTVEIRNTSGGAPGSSVLASASVPAASVSSLGGWVTVEFASPAAVTSGTQYAIVAYTADTGTDTNYDWNVSGSNPYAGGNMWTSLASPPATWGDGGISSDDVAFKTYVANVTTSRVTSPADGTLVFDNEVSSPGQMLTVAGTSDGSTGDSVEIYCDRTNSGGGVGLGALAVQADGSFSGTFRDSNLAFFTPCVVVAEPQGTAPVPPGTPYTGPTIAVSSFNAGKIPSGTNAGKTFDFGLDVKTLTAASGIGSVDSCGLFSALVGPGAPNPNLADGFGCGGTFYNSSVDLSPGVAGVDLTRADLQVDGQNAYGSSSAHRLFSGSDALPGFPAAVVSLDQFDTASGDAQVTDTEPLVRCSPNDVYDPTSADCTAFVSSGVSITRVTRWTHEARVDTVTDTYRSTDSKQHSLDLRYETDINTPASWKLPGQSTFTAHNTGDSAGAPASAPGTIYVGHDPAQPPTLTNPVGAMTFDTPYASIRFDNTLWSSGSAPEDSALIEYRRSVPAGGSTTITWSYATGQTLAEVHRDAVVAEDAMSPPAISITSPAPGGTTVKTPVSVRGTASAGSGIASVTVNGVRAAVSGGGWTAHVPLAPGKDTLTATVTSVGGATKTTSEVVTLAVAKVNTSGRASDKHHGSTVLVTPGVTLSCPAGGHACTAAESATTLAPVSAASAKTKRFVIGKANFTVPAGHKKQLRFGLNHTGLTLLRNLGHLKATIAVISRVDHGTPTTTTKTITIKPPRKH